MASVDRRPQLGIAICDRALLIVREWGHLSPLYHRPDCSHVATRPSNTGIPTARKKRSRLSILGALRTLVGDGHLPFSLGCHAGVPSSSLLSVSACCWEPSAFMTNSSPYG